MKRKFFMGMFLLFGGLSATKAQTHEVVAGVHAPRDVFSLGVRSTMSFFTGDGPSAIGMGTGGQFRIRLNPAINTEWYLDYITADYGDQVGRHDLHIGWSVLFYPIPSLRSSYKWAQPFVEAGHCFDHSHVFGYASPGFADRWSSAVQMGIGNHFNLSSRVDFTFKAQYMMHLGNEIVIDLSDVVPSIHQENGSSLDGHLLLSLSANFKLLMK